MSEKQYARTLGEHEAFEKFIHDNADLLIQSIRKTEAWSIR